MLNQRYPRHVLKAQGRAQLGERAKSEPLNEQKKYARLLDFLSQSAAGSDRLILDRATTDGVVSSSSAAQLLETWFASKYPAKTNQGQDGASLSPDEDDDDDGFAEDNSYWPGGDDTLYGVSIRPEDSNKGRYPGNYTGGYFGKQPANQSKSASDKSPGKAWQACFSKSASRNRGRPWTGWTRRLLAQFAQFGQRRQ